MVYIRADANSKIGMGHIMRCISIAEALRDNGEEIKFLMASNEATNILEQKGLSYVVLNTDYQDMETEYDVLKKIIKNDSKILVDSYYVTNSYFHFLKSFGKVIYIDDVYRFRYDVDCVINGNIYGNEVEYEIPMQLKGCKYAPLRKEFSYERERKKPNNILVTTGGSDPYCLTERILSNILNDEILRYEQYDVVCGRFNESYEKLLTLQSQYENVHIHQDVKEMWKLMQNAKIAITAAGTTMTELSCMGVPIVGFSFVDNQKRIARTFYEEGYSHFGADYGSLKDEIFQEICIAAKELVLDDVLREKYSQKLMNLVDGRGCSRIAQRLIDM